MSPTAPSSKLQRLALVNVCLGQFMSALDSRSVIVALPTISIYFNASLAVVQWIPLAYQLTIIGFVLSWAHMGDMLGRKKIYGSGFLLLALGSACCGISTGLWQLIGFRVLAGIGGAMVLANGRAIVSTLYAQEGRGRALGLTSMAFHLGYITGPSLLTAANIANAMGVAVGSALFLRWLNYYGLSGSVLPPYTQWARSPEVFIGAFQSSWLVIAGLTAIAVVTSAMRGIDTRTNARSGN